MPIARARSRRGSWCRKRRIERHDGCSLRCLGAFPEIELMVRSRWVRRCRRPHRIGKRTRRGSGGGTGPESPTARVGTRRLGDAVEGGAPSPRWRAGRPGRCRVPVARRFAEAPHPMSNNASSPRPPLDGVAIRLSRLSVVAARSECPKRRAAGAPEDSIRISRPIVERRRSAAHADVCEARVIRGVAPGLDRVWNAFADAAIGRRTRGVVGDRKSVRLLWADLEGDRLARLRLAARGQAGLGRRPISSAFGRRRTLGVVARQPIFSAATFGARFEVAFSGSLVGGPRAGPWRCG